MLFRKYVKFNCNNDICENCHNDLMRASTKHRLPPNTNSNQHIK